MKTFKKKPWILVVCICFIVSCKESNAASRSALGEEVFKGINEVALIISGDDAEWMQVALECHGQEEKCADEYINRIPEPMKTTSESRDQYLARIKKDYKNIPGPLRKEALQATLIKAISKKVTPGLTPIIIDNAGEYLDKKDALIVIARIFIYRDIDPSIATLSLSFYRPDISNEARFQSLFYERTTVIPLNLSESEIAKRIEASANSTGFNL
jgi:hypothetical protein